MVLTFSNWRQTETLATAAGGRENEADGWSCAATFAVLPCSKHSCRSSLSVFVALKGLEKRKEKWNRSNRGVTDELKTAFCCYTLGGTWSHWCCMQKRNNVTTKETSFPLYITFLTIHTPTCSCQEGYPRSSVRGGRRTPPWRRSSLGCTEAQKKNGD